MYPKTIATHTLYYHELGEAPKLRGVNRRAKERRDRNRLELAMEYLGECLKNPAYVQNYERKLARGF